MDIGNEARLTKRLIRRFAAICAPAARAVIAGGAYAYLFVTFVGLMTTLGSLTFL